MKTNIWMPLYIGDYLRDTMHLGRESHGSYLLLIMAYWNNQGPLPDDDHYLAQTARCALPEWTQTERKRIAPFFQIESGVWRHSRVDREIEAAKATSEARSRAARAANEAKSRKRSANGAQTEPERSADGVQNAPPSPSQSHIDRESSAVEMPPGFPKTEAEAECAAATVGCGADFAAQTWNKAASRGGCDAKGVPIRSWPHHLKTEWTYEQARRAQQKTPAQSGGKKTLSIWELTKALEIVEGKIAAIKKRGHEDAWGMHIREQDKAEHKSLCDERKRLQDAIQKGGQA